VSAARVVVTGMGAVTPIGQNLPDFWQALVAGRSGIARVTHFDVSNFRSQLAGEVKDFRPELW
jgi:3-oxoacyl-[acyl-carrier-protein] synthase II